MRDCTELSINCFKKWSRKKYSVLLSLHAVIKVCVLCFTYGLIARCEISAQNDTLFNDGSQHRFESVEITGRRSQTVSTSIARIISVIHKDEIERQGLSSFTDILEFISNTDARQRGVMGVQTDISLRGGSFDHVMVLINGINLSDPQTGHFSADIPVDPEIIERIEVLEGPAARSLGPGAFSGAINIITKKGNMSEVSAGQMIGDFNLLRTHLIAGFEAGKTGHILSGTRSSSQGYRHNTDHELYNIYYRANASINSLQLDLQTGYQNKSFGATGFYSPRFPDQREENSGFFGSIKMNYGKTVHVNQHVFWRHKNDHFMLNNIIHNYHLTDVYGSQISMTVPAGNFTWNWGLDLRSENILSNNIGFEMPDRVKVRGTDSAYYNRQYQRTNFSIYAEQVYGAGNWNMTAGLMLNMNTGFHNKVSIFPGFEIGYTTERGHTLFANFNRALHLPTFTDLFYSDPFSQGNINLDPDRLISFEAGLKYSGEVLRYQASVFYNKGNDIIDWLWNYESSRFSPVNLDKLVSAGISSVASVNLTGNRTRAFLPSNITLNYLNVNEDKSSSMDVSKYYSLKHKLSATISKNITNSVILTWKVSYQDRNGEAIGHSEANGFNTIPYDPYWILDGFIKWKFRYFEIYSEVSNILNTRYIDAGYLYQPGRWFRIGVNFRKKIAERDIQ